jgi:dTDP-4-dehydrorhamnose 3,5-epimerase
MIFKPTSLRDAIIVEPEIRFDDRGGFARSFCAKEFASAGMDPCVVQCNISFNHLKGTLRGMHFQKPPASESKLVRCTRGAIYDCIIDLRPGSETYLLHFGIELSEGNHLALFVPKGFAHGYITLTDDTEITYQVSEYYTPGLESGIRFDDPLFGIEWPLDIRQISPKDAAWPDYQPAPPFISNT